MFVLFVLMCVCVFFCEEQGVAVEKRLDVRNTAVKMLLDQTVGAAVNNAGFLTGITLVRGGSWSAAMTVLSEVGFGYESCVRCADLFGVGFLAYYDYCLEALACGQFVQFSCCAG